LFFVRETANFVAKSKQKLLTLNYFDRRNSRSLVLFLPKVVSFRADYGELAEAKPIPPATKM